MSYAPKGAQEGRAGVRSDVSIRFVGPATERHSIDVRDLAPSLLALSDLIEQAHRQAGVEHVPLPALEVSGQRGGSVIVDLLIGISEAEEAFTNLFNSSRAVALANANSIITAAMGALGWTILRHRAGREKEVVVGTTEEIVVNWADGTEIRTTLAARELVESMDFNRTAGRVFEPLRHAGIHEIELTRRDSRSISASQSVSVRKEDLSAFRSLSDGETLISDVSRTVVVKVENLAFKPGNKWRVNDGVRSLWASVDDLGFIQRIAGGEVRFADGDSFLVRMRDRQFQSPTGFRVEHHIERVLDHRSAPPPPTPLF